MKNTSSAVSGQTTDACSVDAVVAVMDRTDHVTPELLRILLSSTGMGGGNSTYVPFTVVSTEKNLRAFGIVKDGLIAEDPDVGGLDHYAPYLAHLRERLDTGGPSNGNGACEAIAGIRTKFIVKEGKNEDKR